MNATSEATMTPTGPSLDIAMAAPDAPGGAGMVSLGRRRAAMCEH